MLVGTSPEVGPPPPQTRPMGLQVGGATSGPPGLAPLKDVLAGAGPEGGAGLGHGELIQLCLGLLSGLSRLVEGIVGHCVGRGRVLWGALWRVAYRGRVRAMPSLSGGYLSLQLLVGGGLLRWLLLCGSLILQGLAQAEGVVQVRVRTVRILSGSSLSSCNLWPEGWFQGVGLSYFVSLV